MHDLKLAFVIADTYQLTQFGLVVVSAPDCPWEPMMKQAVILKLPDGGQLNTEATVMLNSPNPRNVVALKLSGLSIEQVPKGTEVWVN